MNISLLLAGCDPERLAEWQAARLEIEANEPPVLRVLDALCHDEMIRVYGHGDNDDQQRSNVSWLQRALANVVDLRPDRLRKRAA